MKTNAVLLHFLAFICAAVLCTACVPFAFANGSEQGATTTLLNGWVHPAFSATYRYSHQPSELQLDTARVRISEVGFRVDHSMDDSANTLIANFVTDQMWFVDTQRKLVHEVPVLATDLQSEKSHEGGVTLFPGFIQFIPCQGMIAEFKNRVIRQDEELELWSCQLDSGEMVQEQLYSTQLGVVVSSQDSNGFLSQLDNIPQQSFDPDVFRPPTHYRTVDIT
ncbi:MAG: hypothetical protein AB8B79_22315 [Granulosicoccus sp.]